MREVFYHLLIAETYGDALTYFSKVLDTYSLPAYPVHALYAMDIAPCHRKRLGLCGPIGAFVENHRLLHVGVAGRLHVRFDAWQKSPAQPLDSGFALADGSAVGNVLRWVDRHDHQL